MIAAYVNRPPLCYISHVSVIERYKRHGLFKAMELHLEVMATELGCGTLKLEVRNDNIRAIKTYQATGFSMIGKAKDESYFMGKSLFC